MSLLDQLPHRCTIRLRSVTPTATQGRQTTYTDEQTDVQCWQQPAGASSVERYQKRGMDVNSIIYFLSDPGVTTAHQIIITERNGTAVAAAAQIPLEVMANEDPDVTAGLGILFGVAVSYDRGT